MASCIDKYYYRIVNTVGCANHFVPSRRKGFYKFWWDEGYKAEFFSNCYSCNSTKQEESLKEAAIESDRLWKAAGRPRSGSVFSERQRARLQYRRRIREGKVNGNLLIL